MYVDDLRGDSTHCNDTNEALALYIKITYEMFVTNINYYRFSSQHNNEDLPLVQLIQNQNQGNHYINLSNT